MFELKDVIDQPVYLGKLRCVSVLLYEKYMTEASEAVGMEWLLRRPLLDDQQS